MPEPRDQGLSAADREILALIDALPGGATIREPRPTVDRLKAQGLVEAEFGVRVVLTDDGRRLLSNREDEVRV